MSAAHRPDITAWQAVRRLLVIRLDNLGDLLMTTPAIAALRESLPGVYVTLLASPAGAALLPHLPDVDDAIACEASWVKPAPASAHCDGDGDGEDERALVDRLAGGTFDAAVIFTVATQSALPAALVCRMAGIPLRLAHVRENPYRLVSHWVPDTDAVADGMRHEVQRQLDLVRQAGCTTTDARLRFHVRPEDAERARAKLTAAGLARGERHVVVHAGATAASRRYPPERFGAAARELSQRSGRAIVFVGDGGEVPLIDAARAAMGGQPSIQLAGRLSLGELAAAIGDADLFIGNNSGPMHVAAAMGTPVVALYALTNPQHTPWRVPARVLNHPVDCRHCLKSVCPRGTQDCLLNVPVAAVVDAALDLLHAQRVVAQATVPMDLA